MHRDREWLSTAWGRLLGGVVVACVLALPIGLSFALSALKLVHDQDGAMAIIVTFTTALLALPWILALAPLVDVLPFSLALLTSLTMVAWAFNASIALRGWTLSRLLWIAAVLATLQCALWGAYVSSAHPTH